MRILFPHEPEQVDPYDAYRPDDPSIPLLRLNMIASVDGAVTDERGRSGGLGGEADRRLFRVLRALADAIVVGAGTVRAEGYGPHRLSADLRARRRADGRDGPAPVAVVSRSLELDPQSALFVEARTPTIVLTCAAAPAQQRSALAKVGRVIVAGDDDVDLREGIGQLRSEGYAHLLCEGGPSLNTALVDAGLVDELCLTIAPILRGDGGPRLIHKSDGRVTLRLTMAAEDDGELFVRYGVGQ